MINLLLFDTHELIRSGLQVAINAQKDMKLMGFCNSMQDLRWFCANAQPDIVLSDLTFDEGDMQACIPEILHLCPSLIVLTACKDRDVLIQALLCGASGVVGVEKGAETLLKAIRAVYSGEVWVERCLVSELLRTKS
jgi:DNA-binding NarL/FixJ family response regulator